MISFSMINLFYELIVSSFDTSVLKKKQQQQQKKKKKKTNNKLSNILPFQLRVLPSPTMRLFLVILLLTVFSSGLVLAQPFYSPYSYGQYPYLQPKATKKKKTDLRCTYDKLFFSHLFGDIDRM